MSIRNAATLLESGYRLVPSLSAPLTYLVFKPKQNPVTEAPAYQVELHHDPAEGDSLCRRAWSYRCTCELFRQQERHATGDASRCKHGERTLSEWLFKWREVSAVLGYTPEVSGAVNSFSTAPTTTAPTTANVVWSRDEPAPPDAKPDAKAELPWATRRAIRPNRREEDFG